MQARWAATRRVSAQPPPRPSLLPTSPSSSSASPTTPTSGGKTTESGCSVRGCFVSFATRRSHAPWGDGRSCGGALETGFAAIPRSERERTGRRSVAPGLILQHACVCSVVPGLDASQEAEGQDKTTLALPGTQQDMIHKVRGSVAAWQRIPRVGACYSAAAYTVRRCVLSIDFIFPSACAPRATGLHRVHADGQPRLRGQPLRKYTMAVPLPLRPLPLLLRRVASPWWSSSWAGHPSTCPASRTTRASPRSSGSGNSDPPRTVQ